MLYFLLDWLDRLYDLPGFGVFRYLSFRAVMAALFSLFLSVVIGKRIIEVLKRRLVGESIRELGPESHKKKAGTPTMGGVIIILAVLVPAFLWGNLKNAYVILMIVSTLWMGLIGFADDYIKVFRKDKKGLRGKFKIYGQVGLGLIVGLTMTFHPDFQGVKSRLNADGSLRVNELLQRYGFEKGDRILKADGADPFAVEPESEPAVARYEILRNSQSVVVNIPPGARSLVARQIFGQGDVAFATSTDIPFFKYHAFNYDRLVFWDDPGKLWARAVYVLVCIFIVTAVSNGVNITDGLDGLAAGTSAIAAGALGVFAYLSGNFVFAGYLNISYIPHAGELFIFSAALIGACVGFLWYNTYPAQVFMGDTGSLALGGAIGALALMTKKELLLPLICGIFFIESLSVIVQVSYFKYTKKKFGQGKRIFLMSPLHHHYELRGWAEPKIVARFWIIAVILTLAAFSTLKLR
jgi:phospho-N-acetylmuramoyl-pentapeptide-transferase